MAAMFAAAVTGCGSNANSSSSTIADNSSKTAVVSEKKEEVSLAQLSNSKADEESAFTKRDLEQTADTSEAKSITVSDDMTIVFPPTNAYGVVLPVMPQ